MVEPVRVRVPELKIAPPLYAVAILKPQSPEQLAWSLLQATGYTDAERKALGAMDTEAALYARLSGQAAPVTAAFANQPATPQRTGSDWLSAILQGHAGL